MRSATPDFRPASWRDGSATALSRRGFLGAAAGLCIAFSLSTKRGEAAATSNKLNAYVHVGSDDIVTLFIHKAEMGQGTVTSLSQLLADELESDLNKVRIEFAPVSREYGGMQGVFGSQSKIAKHAATIPTRVPIHAS